jgi:hypothetical protein
MRKGGIVRAAAELMRKGEIQSGFRACVKLGLIECSVEWAVLHFPKLFNAEVRRVASWGRMRVGAAGV